MFTFISHEHTVNISLTPENKLVNFTLFEMYVEVPGNYCGLPGLIGVILVDPMAQR